VVEHGLPFVVERRQKRQAEVYRKEMGGRNGSDRRSRTGIGEKKRERERDQSRKKG
jgi:hypothetical protein